MVLHLIPDSPDDLVHDIRQLPSATRPARPALREWTSDPKDQTIIHVATGCMFQAIRLDLPRAEGIVVPFAPTYEVAVRFVGMSGNAERLPSGTIIDLGRQGIEWILTHTFEARNRTA